MYIKNFKNITIKDSDIAGGKGASLGEMSRIKLPVPPGFVVMAGAYDEFLERNGLDDKIKKILKGLKPGDVSAVEKASKKIRSIMNKAEFPADMKEEIIEEFIKLKSPSVAVRSSATAEDSAKASWAGQLESYLNVDKKNLFKAIKECWSSLYSCRAILYRFEKKLLNKKISVAVVIQKMVKSEISGIAFTVDPVIINKNKMIIEACFGLGEAIVGGMITPDAYIIDKKSKKIIDKSISEQAIMIIGGTNGTREVKVPNEKRRMQKVADKEIIKLANLCLIIEKHYKMPQDIEWAYENGKLYITQSRPIATIKI